MNSINVIDKIKKSWNGIVNNFRNNGVIDTLSKRKIRTKISANYKTVKSLYFGVFGEITGTNRYDYIDDDVMVLCKIVGNLDRTVTLNVIKNVQLYGFDLTVYAIDENTYKVLLVPSQLIRSYLTDTFIQSSDLRYRDIWTKMLTQLEY